MKRIDVDLETLPDERSPSAIDVAERHELRHNLEQAAKGFKSIMRGVLQYRYGLFTNDLAMTYTIEETSRILNTTRRRVWCYEHMAKSLLAHRMSHGRNE